MHIHTYTHTQSRSKTGINFKMATTPVAREFTSFAVTSYIRGYHAYKATWSPSIGEARPLKREPENVQDSFAVAVRRNDEVVGHIPFNLAPIVSAFLRRSTNRAIAEVTGSKVNRGAGYGLEVPCKYHFFGPKEYIDKLRTLCDSLRSDGLL